MKTIGKKIYGVCHNCAKIVCLSKIFSGGLHICTNKEEQQKYRKQIDEQVKKVKSYLYN